MLMNPNEFQQPPVFTGPPPSKNKFLSLLPWIVVVLLVLALVASTALWKPWETKIPANSRTVEVTGTATLKAEPDEFTFNPSYQFKGTDKPALIDQLTKKSEEVVSAIKKLGVDDSKIKSDASGFSNNYFFDSTDGTTTYTLTLTVSLSDKDKAQKVQDYLVTTSPEDRVTPYSTFSTEKEKQLQSKARDQATKDARSKADQSAKNLGFSVGEVKSVTDGDGFGAAQPYAVSGGATTLMAEDVAKTTSLSVQPGENELSYSVKVTYFIK
jgi:uncharacterized protein